MDAKEADESVAEKFTRVMNATPSRFGVLGDLTIASAISGAILVVGLVATRSSSTESTLFLVLALALALLPLGLSLLFSVTLRGSRARVVDWLASLPFSITNMNALLAGLGDTLEVVFERDAEMPPRAKLQPMLDQISDDVLVVKERPEERLVEIRLGIIDSKRMPLLTNHRRYERLVLVVERTLVPLAKTSRIRNVHVV